MSGMAQPILDSELCSQTRQLIAVHAKSRRLNGSRRTPMKPRLKTAQTRKRTSYTIGAELQDKFREHYGARARIYRAPGRVNLIGEHTDYNEGLVMPAAIDFYVWVGVSPRNDRRLLVYSENFSESIEIDLRKDKLRPRKHWSDYVAGVASMLEQAQCRLQGANLLIQGDVPIGSGLSSSAAVEVAVGFALLENSGISVDRFYLARICQRAENEFVGARVGIMDQFVACYGQAGNALKLDCRSLEYDLLPVPGQVSLVICNTMVKHELAGGEYNTRRAECEEGVRLLSRMLPNVRSLRDVSLSDLERHARGIPELIYKRCRHVVTENARVAEAADDLERGDLATFGRLMAESHHSLRNDYQVSCSELDLMVDLAKAEHGAFGTRMTGGGFGGCTISLVTSESVGEFAQNVSAGYQRFVGFSPQIFASTAAEGACEIEA
jgi:galactokinase